MDDWMSHSQASI